MADPFKHEVAMGTAAKIGNLLSSRHSELELRIVAAKGAQDAAITLSSKMQELQAVVAGECEADGVDIDVHKRVAKHVNNCALLCQKFGLDQAKRRELLRGKLEGVGEAMAIANQIFKVEEAQLERARKVEEELAAAPQLNHLKEVPPLPPSEAPQASDQPEEPEPPQETSPQESIKPNKPTVSDEEVRDYARKHGQKALVKEAKVAGVSPHGRKTALARKILEAKTE